MALKKLAIDSRSKDKDFLAFRNLLDKWKVSRSKKKQKEMTSEMAMLFLTFIHQKVHFLSGGEPAADT